jgi:hypothetical protein
MHVARPMCMRMSVRLRGYVSTSSHPALMHEHVGTAAAGGGRVVFNCDRARLRDADLHVHYTCRHGRGAPCPVGMFCARVGVALAPGGKAASGQEPQGLE